MSSLNAIATPSQLAHPAMPPEPVVGLTVEQYHELIRSGALPSGAPVELLDGFLVTKMTKSPLHVAVVRLLRESLRQLLGQRYLADNEIPLTLAGGEPEPDVVVISGQTHDYLDRHPGPAETHLVIEVADTSLTRDRTWKRRIYAASGIPAYWIVNLIDRVVEVHTRPQRSGDEVNYADMTCFGSHELIPVFIGGVEQGLLAVADFLPPRTA